MPLETPLASHCVVYVPTFNCSFASVATTSPEMLNTVNLTYPERGRENPIVVLGLNGFGSLTGPANLGVYALSLRVSNPYP